ncbi:hypothetical protein THASP1DRAFT_28293 [Thamnocephalis sphaerospora]|uniref:J domain-containing protein n=1 Tax=Thamnocephalis sphaerospora TaxID=78915 RepID=A0A4P9XWX0_9FUNG|nr:hypothetical protein THASP1DRAFT_28293 [Thamnocephalis sphaerospora]|eukprot:RKP09930.1 hypothetical protein THASP1DRAFT_28293 [Thamnocephalis sphaerospora]
MRVDFERVTALLLLLTASCALVPQAAAETDEGAATSFEALLQKADSHAEAGRFLAALDGYEAVVEMEPDNYVGYWKRATTRQSMGKQHMMADDLARVLDLKPDFEEARLARAKLLASEGKFEDARHDLEQMENAEGEAEVLRDDVASAEKAWQAAETAFAEGKHEECIAQATEAQRVVTRVAQLRRLRAKCYMAHDQIDHAVNDLSRAAGLDPEDADTHLLAARLKFFALDSPKVALSHVKQCLHYDPEHKQCKALFRRLKKIDKEVKAATDSASAEKWSAAMRKVAGPVGKPEEGAGHMVQEELNQLETELGLSGHLPRKLFARLAGIACQGYSELKLADKGVRWCSDAIKYDPDNVDAYVSRGDMYLLKEELDDALGDFNTAKDKSGGGDHRIRERINRTTRLQAKASRKDYYKILGVPRDASKREIKKAFRKLAQQWHPDTYRGDLPPEKVEKKMSELNEAYEVLSDDDKRAQVDQGIDPNDPHGGHGGHGHGGFHQQHHHGGFGGGDPFQFFFGGGGGGGGQRFQFSF